VADSQPLLHPALPSGSWETGVAQFEENTQPWQLDTDYDFKK
jgi:hypothetical protein